MLKLFNSFLVIAVLGSAFLVYDLEHQTRGLERNNARLRAQIVEAQEDVKLLKAEWSSLTRPDRIQKFAVEQLHMTPLKATQFVALEALSAHVPAEGAIKLEAEGEDAIGDILKKMQ
jgi:cell division protein FtsL